MLLRTQRRCGGRHKPNAAFVGVVLRRVDHDDGGEGVGGVFERRAGDGRKARRAGVFNGELGRVALDGAVADPAAGSEVRDQHLSAVGAGAVRDGDS